MTDDANDSASAGQTPVGFLAAAFSPATRVEQIASDIKDTTVSIPVPKI